MQRANETQRFIVCSAAGAAKGMLLGVILTACVANGSPAPAPNPDLARDAALLQPLWHAAAAAAPSSVSMPSMEVPLHHFDLPCSTCHESADQSDKSWRLTNGINKGCTSGACHDYDPVLNHPLGVPVPAETRGHKSPERPSRITCITCHVPADGQSQTTDPGHPDSVLAYPDSDLCASCHLQMNSAGSRRSHWRFSTKAHLGDINPLGSSKTTIEIPLGHIDDESMACLNCHDDITVTIPSENETRQEQVARWAGMQDHAIGMDYPSVAGRQMTFFNYPVPTTGHVRLFDGRVGCGSCHSLYARGNSNFTVAERGDLCRKCHIR